MGQESISVKPDFCPNKLLTGGYVLFKMLFLVERIGVCISGVSLEGVPLYSLVP